jgi:hypothetical protein
VFHNFLQHKHLRSTKGSYNIISVSETTSEPPKQSFKKKVRSIEEHKLVDAPLVQDEDTDVSEYEEDEEELDILVEEKKVQPKKSKEDSEAKKQSKIKLKKLIDQYCNCEQCKYDLNELRSAEHNLPSIRIALHRVGKLFVALAASLAAMYGFEVDPIEREKAFLHFRSVFIHTFGKSNKALTSFPNMHGILHQSDSIELFGHARNYDVAAKERKI